MEGAVFAVRAFISISIWIFFNVRSRILSKLNSVYTTTRLYFCICLPKTEKKEGPCLNSDCSTNKQCISVCQPNQKKKRRASVLI